MLLLLGVGFLAGVITGLSPCIIPVLPVIVAGGATSAEDADRRRPYVIIAGLVASFTLFTLVGSALLRLLHLPQDFLEWLGVALLMLLALGLIVPRVGELIERPFARLGGRHTVSSAGGFVLGMSLGLVFVPCAGPVLAAISAVVANHRIGPTAVLLTLAYAAGAAVPLLVLALVVQRWAGAWKAVRTHLPMVRRVSGFVLFAVALAIAFNWTSSLTTVPGYTSSLETHLDHGAGVTGQLQSLGGEHANRFAAKQNANPSVSLPNLGRAPDFAGVTAWLNTPGGRPLTLAGLRGKVVLVDFWTYSCINCQRSLPHVEAWYARYEKYGLVVVGVHTPEFPFEHVVSNVAAAATRLGVRYPVAVDDTYKTWDAYNNEYWPAEYLIDQQGVVRHTDFGEGDYTTTEADIRELLEAGGAHHLPPPTGVATRTPTSQLTTETYLGYERFATTRYVGTPVVRTKSVHYKTDTTVPADDVSFGGTWTQQQWSITAGPGAVIRLTYTAEDIYLVLGGQGTVGVSVNGRHVKTVAVSGVPDLYTMDSFGHMSSGLLTLTVSPGVQAYDFTFG